MYEKIIPDEMKLLSLDDMVHILRIDMDGVKKLVKDGILAMPFTIGKVVYFKQDDVSATIFHCSQSNVVVYV